MCSLPGDDAAAAYAKNPIPELASIKVQGGFWYLGTKYGKTFTDGTHKFLPRLGLVYQINNKMVLRGGYGMFADTFNPMNDRGNQNGYSQATSTNRNYRQRALVLLRHRCGRQPFGHRQPDGDWGYSASCAATS